MTIARNGIKSAGFERGVVLVSCVLGFALDLYDLLILPFLLPAIRESLGLSMVSGASIASCSLLGSVLGGAVFGRLADRHGRKPALQWSLALFGLGSIASAFAWDGLSLAVMRFVTGIGLGGEWGIGMVIFNEMWPERRRGLGSALIQTGAVLGSAMSAVVGVWAITHFPIAYGWRVGLLTGGAPILLIIFIRRLMPESRVWLDLARGGRGAASGSSRHALAALFAPVRRRRTLAAVAWLTGYMFAYYAFSVFAPTLMMGPLAASPSIIQITMIASSVMGGVAFLGMGLLNDRFGRKWGAVLPAIAWIVTFGLFVGIGQTRSENPLIQWPFFWIMIGFAIGNAGIAVAGAWLSELYPTEIRATALSSIYMAARGIGSLAPLAVPLVAQIAGSLADGMVIALPAAIMCLVAALYMPETLRRVGEGQVGSPAKGSAGAII